MEVYIFQACVGFVLGVPVWLLKNAYNETKETLKEYKHEIALLKETKLSKTDFKEFKEELWDRFDRLESSLKNQIRTM